MIKLFLFLFLLFGHYSFGQTRIRPKTIAQEPYIETGISNTYYAYLSDLSSDDLELDSSTGVSLRLGFGEIIENLNYGFSYQQFNSIGSLYDNSFEWKANYVGGFIQYNLPLVENRLIINPAIEFLTFLNGTQFSFGDIYKLGDEKEFTGAWVSPRIGVTFVAFELGKLLVGIGFNLSYTLKPITPTEESLNFISQQICIKLGI